MRMRSLLFIPLAALAVALVRPASAAVVVDGIVAVVNGEIITLLELEKAGAAVLEERLRAVAPADREQVRRETLKPLLDEATQITIWESGGKDYNLFFRPLLPDEV
jgi:hypothetical protein